MTYITVLAYISLAAMGIGVGFAFLLPFIVLGPRR